MAVFRPGNGQPGDLSPEELLAEVRRALVHLYDPIYLQHSVLVRLLKAQGQEEIGVGQDVRALRKVLLEAIEQLGPAETARPGGHQARSDQRRSYEALRGRYVDQLADEDLAHALSVSDRQLRRDLRAGLDAVSDIVWRRLQRALHEAAPRELEGPASGAVQAEIDGLPPNEGPVNLCAEGRNVHALVATLARSASKSLRDGIEPESVIVRANRVLLRQALLSLYTWALGLGHGGGVASRVLAADAGRAVFELAYFWEFAAPAEPPGAESALPVELRQALHAECRLLQRPEGGIIQLLLPSMPLHALLLVDDNQGLHHLLKRYLSGLPVNVFSAYDGPSGLALARSVRPEVIVLDIMMPDHDGWELLAALQGDEATRSIPVIICSVLAQEPLARSLAVAGYIRKPITQSALLAALQNLGFRDLV